MENNASLWLLTSQFKEHRRLTKTTIAGNLLIILPFLFANLNFLWQNMHVVFSLLSGILILTLVLFYDWKNALVNLAIVITYLAFFIMELVLVGIPSNPMPPSSGFSKGMLLDLAMIFVPWIYMGLRIAFIIPLIQVALSSYKLIQKLKVG